MTERIVQPSADRVEAATGSQRAAAQQALDDWVRELMAWHFSPETGCEFWLAFARQAGWDPREAIQGFGDLGRFGPFEDHWLRETPLENWVPRAYAGQPYHVFETGGTTGPPKQRIDWEDYQIDYEAFSRGLDPESFPLGADWLMLGPTGPRRLRLSIEHLANHRGGACFHVDLDPRWVVKLLHRGQADVARAYMEHVIEQGLTLLETRPIRVVFTTPRLIEALSEKTSLKVHGVRGVLCGGTSISAQVHRFIVEELLDGVAFVPVYGNTLMGLAACKPTVPEDAFSITYFAPQPRAVLQVLDPAGDALVPYGEWGRVRLTTLTKEFFLPNFYERDEAIRAEPIELYPWDGVREVRPFGGMEKPVIEGVY